MKTDFPVEKTIKERQSVRTYEGRTLSDDDKKILRDYITGISNPFSVEVSFHFLEAAAVKEEKLGTYGVIKGAKDFVGVSVAPGELSLEALGYSFEKLVLYITSLGLGTCWLGGTFERNKFAEAMNLKEGELFPVISPIGYPLGKRRAMESLARWVAKSEQRKDWNELFFNRDFSHPLNQFDAGDYAFPLEMLRLAPSAMNKQPWRIVKAENTFHFYEAKSSKERLGIDIQKVDVGIGACHFHLAAHEKDLPGRFEKLANPAIQVPNQTVYLFSWIVD